MILLAKTVSVRKDSLCITTLASYYDKGCIIQILQCSHCLSLVPGRVREWRSEIDVGETEAACNPRLGPTVTVPALTDMTSVVQLKF